MMVAIIYKNMNFDRYGILRLFSLLQSFHLCQIILNKNLKFPQMITITMTTAILFWIFMPVVALTYSQEKSTI